MKFIKGIVWALLGAVGTLIVLIGLLLLLIDPNDYRQKISQAAKEAAGIDLQINGDLQWSFYPILGFKTEQVRLAVSERHPEIMRVGQLGIGVELVPLFSQSLQLETLLIAGLNVHLKVDKEGNNNWSITTPDEEATQEPPMDEDADSGSTDVVQLSDLKIGSIQIVDATIHYQDDPASLDYLVQIASLTLTNVMINKAFPMSLDAIINEGNNKQVAIDLDTDLMVEVPPGKSFTDAIFRMQNMQTTVNLNGYLEKPATIELTTDLDFDLGHELANVKSQVILGNATADLTVKANQVLGDVQYQGLLQFQSDNIKQLMSSLGMVLPETANDNVLKIIKTVLPFSGGTNSIAMKPLNIKLDESTLAGSVEIVDISRQALRFDLTLDQINLAFYQMPTAEEPAPVKTPSETPSATKPESDVPKELIPVELVRTLDVEGRIQIKRLLAQRIPIDNMLLKIKAHQGMVNVSTIQAELLSGDIRGQAHINAQSNVPQMAFKLKANQLDMKALSRSLAGDNEYLSGISSFSLDTTAKGNDVDTLMKQAIGKMNLQLTDGMIHGVNLNQVLKDGLQTQFTRYQSVYPTLQKYFPKELKEDTVITELLANVKIENGNLIMPNFTFSIPGSAVKANGKFGLLNNRFDYQFGIKLSSIERNKYLKGTFWPIRCRGEISQSPQNWCRPDSREINDIFKDATKQALKDKSAREISENLGMDAKDKAEFEDNLKEKLKQKEDRAKEKLKKKFDKLFD